MFNIFMHSAPGMSTSKYWIAHSLKLDLQKIQPALPIDKLPEIKDENGSKMLGIFMVYDLEDS